MYKVRIPQVIHRVILAQSDIQVQAHSSLSAMPECGSRDPSLPSKSQSRSPRIPANALHLMFP